MTKPKFDIIIDSGAFSAWRLGKSINLKEYCEFLQINADWIGSSVALDVINPGDPNAAAAESYRNYKFMRRQGLRPIPVFHVGEDIEWLFRYLDAGAEYIGLSSSSIVAKGAASDWYALAWSFLVDAKGLPTIRAHAFGEGRVENLSAYPWYSADSTSWIYSSQNSGIIQYDDRKRIAFRNDGLSTNAAPDAARLDASDRAILLRVLKEVGLKESILEQRGEMPAFVSRCLIAARYYTNLERRISAQCPISYVPRGLLLPNNRRNAAVVDIPSFKMHLVVGGNHTALSVAHVEGHRNILASYYYINSASHLRHLKGYILDPTRTISDPELPFYRHYTTLLSCLREDHPYFAREGVSPKQRILRSGVKAPKVTKDT